MRHPLERLSARLPGRGRVVLDWVVTLAGAVLAVLAVKAWIVNPYRVPSSSMEPTLHCARPAYGCRARFSDRVLASRFVYHFEKPARGDIVVFQAPGAAVHACGEGGTFVKRLIGLPGDTVHEDGSSHLWIDGRLLHEPYVGAAAYAADTTHRNATWHVPAGSYFFLGDNRALSCDSRDWGSVPAGSLVGRVFAVYWPPNRLGLR